MVNEAVEQYNDKAEKTGMKNFIISTPSNSDDSEENGFNIVIQREVCI